jgi:putative NIF3 family GTP cyclohydrolase 1 type 2
VKGRIKPEHRDDFKKRLETYYGRGSAVAFGGKESIETVAIISGGAYKMLGEAAGLDAFITGSYDLPAWNQAFEEKINFFALGHHATERVGPLALKEKLESLYNIPCVFIEEDNPF